MSNAKTVQAPFKQALTPYSVGVDTSVEDACRLAASAGAQGIDFFSNPKDWPLMRQHGLICSLYKPDPGGGISALKRIDGPPGWNAIGMKEAQGEFLEEMRRVIDLTADHGVPNILLQAGTRHTVTYEEGADNAVAFCKPLREQAERRGVSLVIELVNSKMQFGPPLSLFDKSAWGFDVVKRVGSPRIKVLYDIFHAQIMEGDIAATLRANIELIGHIHVAGVPGRHQLDDDQELNYDFIGRVIAETGYREFVSHEWIPRPGSDVAAAARMSVARLAAAGASVAKAA